MDEVEEADGVAVPLGLLDTVVDELSTSPVATGPLLDALSSGVRMLSVLDTSTVVVLSPATGVVGVVLVVSPVQVLMAAVLSVVWVLVVVASVEAVVLVAVVPAVVLVEVVARPEQ